MSFSTKPMVTMISNLYYSMIKIQWYMYNLHGTMFIITHLFLD